MATSEQILKVQRILPSAKLPVRSSPGAAGYDLFAGHDRAIPPLGKSLVPTGLRIILPPGTYGQIAPRSGLALHYFIDIGAGIIDEDYRGEIGVLMFNFSNQTFKVRQGDRIAQLIIQKYVSVEIQECPVQEETQRGSQGFGSTGR